MSGNICILRENKLQKHDVRDPTEIHPMHKEPRKWLKIRVVGAAWVFPPTMAKYCLGSADGTRPVIVLLRLTAWIEMTAEHSLDHATYDWNLLLG